MKPLLQMLGVPACGIWLAGLGPWMLQRSTWLLRPGTASCGFVLLRLQLAIWTNKSILHVNQLPASQVNFSLSPN